MLQKDGRAKIDSGNSYFDNAHLIADRFGGSGYNNDMNIYPSSSFYNRREMATVEENIAQNTNHSTNYDLEVTAVLKDDDESTMGSQVRKNLEKEFSVAQEKIKPENKKQDKKNLGKLREKLQNALTLDLKNVPAHFQSTTYKSETVSFDDIDLNQLPETTAKIVKKSGLKETDLKDMKEAELTYDNIISKISSKIKSSLALIKQAEAAIISIRQWKSNFQKY